MSKKETLRNQLNEGTISREGLIALFRESNSKASIQLIRSVPNGEPLKRLIQITSDLPKEPRNFFFSLFGDRLRPVRPGMVEYHVTDEGGFCPYKGSFASVRYFGNGIAVVGLKRNLFEFLGRLPNKYTFITPDGKAITDQKFSLAESFSDINRARVRIDPIEKANDNKHKSNSFQAIIDREGKIISNKYFHLGELRGYRPSHAVIEPGVETLVTIDGEEIGEKNNKIFEEYQGFWAVKSQSGECYFIDDNLERRSKSYHSINPSIRGFFGELAPLHLVGNGNVCYIERGSVKEKPEEEFNAMIEEHNRYRRENNPFIIPEEHNEADPLA